MTFNFSPLDESFLTIITATYNSSDFITQCLSSLSVACENTKSFGLKISHLVIDGDSKDNTTYLISKISPKSIVMNRQKGGIYDALNYGISLVKSSYVMYLHSDDELDEHFLNEMLTVLQKYQYNSLTIFNGTVEFIDNNSITLFRRKPPIYSALVQKYANLVFHPNAIYPTNLEQKYPYSTAIGLSSDHAHITEISKVAKVVGIPNAKYRFRISDKSSTIMSIEGKSPHIASSIIVSFFKKYLYFFENKLLVRIIMKLANGKSYWRL